jgi:drug/metabolite transporter (DMT)-like permease
MQRFKPSPYLLLVLTTLFWAGNWVVGRAVRGDVPPIALAFWRWVIALALMAPLAWPHLKQEWRTALQHVPILALLGLLGTGLYNALAYVGLQYTTAINGLLLNSFVPVVIIAVAWSAFGKRLRPVEGLGVILSLAGVFAIVARGELGALRHLRFNVGDLWVLASVAAWALYTNLLHKRPAGLHPLAFLVCLAAVGLVAMAPIYAWELTSGRSIRPSAAAYAGIAYAGIFPAFLGYLFWNRAVAQIGAHKAAPFIHLMPVFGIVLALLFLNERPALYHAAGIALIFGGIYLATFVRPRIG